MKWLRTMYDLYDYDTSINEDSGTARRMLKEHVRQWKTLMKCKPLVTL